MFIPKETTPKGMTRNQHSQVTLQMTWHHEQWCHQQDINGGEEGRGRTTNTVSE